MRTHRTHNARMYINTHAHAQRQHVDSRLEKALPKRFAYTKYSHLIEPTHSITPQFD